MKKRILVSFLIIMNSFGLYGCDYKDIDRRAFVVAIGIDGTENKGEIEANIKISKAIAVGKEASPNAKNFIIYKIRVNSIGEVFRQLRTIISSEPDYSHMKLLVLSKAYTEKNDTSGLIDFFVRRRDLQLMSIVAVSEGKTEEVLSFSPPFEKFAGNATFMKFGQGVRSPYAVKTELYKLYKSMKTDGNTPYCGVLEMEDDKLQLEKTALFHEGKLKLMLNKDETKLLNMFTNGIRNTYLTVESIDEDNKSIGIGLIKGNAKMKIKSNNNGEIICHVKVKAEAIAEEISIGDNNEEVVELRAEEILSIDIKKLLEKLKQEKLDPLQIQNRYWAKTNNYELKKSWLEEEYSKVKFEVESDIEIANTGTLKN